MSLLVDHMGPRRHLSPRSIYVYFGTCTCRYEILRLSSVDPHFIYLKSIFKIVCYQSYRNYKLWVLQHHPSWFFGKLRLRINIWYFIKEFRLIPLHDFDVGLLMRYCYPKRSSNPLSNFPINVLNGAY